MRLTVAHDTIFGPSVLAGGFDLPCSNVMMSRDGRDNVWTIRAFGVPTDALRPLRMAIGPSVAGFDLALTDYAGRSHHGRGILARSEEGELGYQLAGDELTFVFEGQID